jgi:hypothetical protein
MSLLELFRNTDKQKAHDIVFELFNNKSASIEQDDVFLQTMSDRANAMPILKGVQEGVSDYLTNLIADGSISEEDANKCLTGVDMARFVILAYIESEVPDVLPEPPYPFS